MHISELTDGGYHITLRVSNDAPDGSGEGHVWFVYAAHDTLQITGCGRTVPAAIDNLRRERMAFMDEARERGTKIPPQDPYVGTA